MAKAELFSGYDHIAYATRDTDATVKVLTALGFSVRIYRQKLEKFNVYVTKMVSEQEHVAEIVEPAGERSAVSGVLGEESAAVYHTCFRTRDFARAVRELKAAGAMTITKPMGLPYPVTPHHAEFQLTHMYHPHLGVFEITGPVVASEEDSASTAGSGRDDAAQ